MDGLVEVTESRLISSHACELPLESEDLVRLQQYASAFLTRRSTMLASSRKRFYFNVSSEDLLNWCVSAYLWTHELWASYARLMTGLNS
jgi:hypothetical protein